MLEGDERNLVDGDVASAEPPFLVERIYGLILHLLVKERKSRQLLGDQGGGGTGWATHLNE
jgi:hypothetical protein